MAEDQATVVEPDGTPDPPEISLRDALEWDADARGPLPEDFSSLPLDDIRAAVAEQTQAALEAERERWATVQAEEARRRKAEEQSLASQRTDLDWYETVRRRLNSTEEEEVKAAAKEMAEQQDRYTAAAAAAQRQSQQSQLNEAWRSLVTVGHREMTQAGFTNFMPEPGSIDFTVWATNELAKFDGKGGVFAYAVDYGKRLGHKEGYEEGIAEGERRARITEGLETAPAIAAPQMNSGSGVSPQQYAAMSPVQRRDFNAKGGRVRVE